MSAMKKPCRGHRDGGAGTGVSYVRVILKHPGPWPRFYNPGAIGGWPGGSSAGKKCWVGVGVVALRVYGRALATSELVANFRAGRY